MANNNPKYLTLPGGQRITYVPEEDYLRMMREEVEPYLARMCHKEDVPVSGGTLHAENYVLPGADKAIILVHGYTESAEKLRELVWYFLQAGFSVFSYDERGHGQSVRHVEELDLTHVNFFQDYVNDLEDFIIASVRPAVGKVPLYLFAHSMGGAVGAHFLIRHPDTFERAILHSPMIAPSSAPYPLWVGRTIAEVMCLFGQEKTRAFIAGKYDQAKEPFETSYATSQARFAYYAQKRRSTPHLQNCGPTYRWVRESMAQTSGLLKNPDVKKVRTKVLVVQAALDTVVCLDEQQQFADLLPDARLMRVEKAKHEIYLSADDVMQPYMEQMLSFLLAE